jgi:hypothetical protein
VFGPIGVEVSTDEHVEVGPLIAEETGSDSLVVSGRESGLKTPPAKKLRFPELNIGRDDNYLQYSHKFRIYSEPLLPEEALEFSLPRPLRLPGSSSCALTAV